MSSFSWSPLFPGANGSQVVDSLNGLVGALTLAAGSNIVVSSNGIDTITVALNANPAVSSVIYNGSVSGALTLQAAATTTSYTLKWPSGQGGMSQFLQNDGTGQLVWANGTGSSGVSSIGTIDSQSKSANGLVISGTTLYAQSADASFPGMMTIGTQTIAGDKTFSGNISAANLSGTNTGDVTLTAVGSSPSANGASLSGQALTLQPADGTHPGLVTSGAQTLGGVKTFSSAPNFSSLTASQALVLDGSKNVTTLGYSSSNTNSFLAQRDSNGNTAFNNFIGTTTSTVSSATPISLTAGSARYQKITGTSAQTINLPDATTLITGWIFEINNNSTGAITIKDNGGTTLYTIPAGGYANSINTNNGSAAGSWDIHSSIPSNSSWGTSSLVVGALGTGIARADSSTVTVAELSGDITTSGSNATTLATVNSNVGSFTYSSITVNGKGLVTAASSGAAPVTTLAAFGSSPNANGASISSNTLTLQPADSTHPGGVSTASQTFGGSKVFASAPAITDTSAAHNVILSAASSVTLTADRTLTIDTANVSSTLKMGANLTVSSAATVSGTNTGDITLAAVGSSPSANGASLSGQQLTLQPFDSTHPGVVTASSGGTTNFLRADGTWAAPTGSGTAYNVTSQSTTYNAVINDYIIASGASFTITLPTAASQSGKTIVIQHNGTSLSQVYTLNTTSSQTINGPGGTVSSGNYALYTNGEILQVTSDGSNWQVSYHRTESAEVNGGPLSITSTGSAPAKGTVTYDTFYWKRVGTECLFRYDFRQSTGGTAGSGDYIITLPTNLTIDTGKVEANNNTIAGDIVTTYTILGSGVLCDGTNVNNIFWYCATSSTVKVWITGVAVWNGSSRTLGSTTLALSINGKFPVSNWQP